jgi:hypothetical protein
MGLEQNKKAAGVDAERPFSTLPIQEPEPVLGNFTDVQPTHFNQVGVAAPNDPGVTEDKELPSFGRGLVGAFKDVREGTVKNVPAILRPLAFPLVKAGQGFLAASEWGGNVAETVAPHIVDPIQRVLPGQQSFERLVDEQVQKGIPRSKALRKAWEDHHGTWELPFKIPFATTAFTPEGSITLDCCGNHR